MSGRILRQAPSVDDPIAEFETDSVLMTNDTSNPLRLQDHDGSSIFDGTVVAPSKSQRLSQPVSHPTDAQGRLQRVEFVVDNQTSSLEKHDIMLANVNNSINKLKSAVSFTHHNSQNNTDKLITLRNFIKNMYTEVKQHGTVITQIQEVHISRLAKELAEYMDMTNTNREVLRDQYQEIMNTINELHDFMEDIQAATNDHFNILSDHSKNITDLNSTVNGIITLINNWTIIKRTVIKIALVIGGIISVCGTAIYTLYASGVLAKLAKILVLLTE